MSTHIDEILGLDYDHLPALLTVPQFAQLVQLKTDRVTKMLRAGQIPGVRLGPGANWRIPKSVIKKYLDLA